MAPDVVFLVVGDNDEIYGLFDHLADAEDFLPSSPVIEPRIISYCKQGQEDGGFNPDWSLLEASHGVIREQAAQSKELFEKLNAVERLADRAATDRDFDDDLIDCLRDILSNERECIQRQWMWNLPTKDK